MPEQDPNEVTMWSESIFEGLFLVLRKSQDETKIRLALKELLAKGYKPPLIIEKVREELGDDGAGIVERMFKSGAAKSGSGKKGGGGAPRRRQRPGASVYRKGSGDGDGQSSGFLDWLKSLFGKS